MSCKWGFFLPTYVLHEMKREQANTFTKLSHNQALQNARPAAETHNDCNAAFCEGQDKTP